MEGANDSTGLTDIHAAVVIISVIAGTAFLPTQPGGVDEELDGAIPWRSLVGRASASSPVASVMIKIIVDLRV